MKEARVAGKLLHPNIVVTYDAATDEETGIPFIVMELVEGETLSERLRKRGALPWKEALELVIPLARALEYAHESGIVHRDIKPSNIILTEQGVPKIADFGIAKLPADEDTETGTVTGTPYFMSPEQLMGKPIDGRCDIFSLGVLLYSCISGSRPFDGPDVATIVTQVLYKNPPPVSELIPEVPEALNGVLARALEKDTERRYRTVVELVGDLLAVARGEVPTSTISVGEALVNEAVVAAGPPSQPQPSGAPRRRLRPRLDLRILTLAATLSVAIGIFILGRESFWGDYRGTADLAERTEADLFYEATVAFENGDLEESQLKLEELLEENPDFAGASQMLQDVDVQLWKETLPLSFNAKHNHRIGECTGKLSLTDWGIEYRSTEHGVWRWTFDEIRIMERPSRWRLELETEEMDLLVMGRAKKYKFEFRDAPLEDQAWRRYQRLAEKTRAK
jgi:hypothetical protein